MTVKSGYAAIVGKPNAGKSTLLNAILGEKLSITNPKPQTTRKRILGILSSEEYQIVFLDTPGILKPGYLLQEKMMDHIFQSVKDADVILFLVDIVADPDGSLTLGSDEVKNILSMKKKNQILVLNKIDLSDEQKVKALINQFENDKRFDKVIPVSALLNFNTAAILSAILEYIPEHPKFYPDDRLSDEPEKFFVSEIIREKILEEFQEEIPYSVEVVIEEFKEIEGRKDLIRASIIVEKESQKPIIIGKKGLKIKELGKNSREDIEKFLQRPVFLELQVKVKSKWRSNPNYLKSFGYTLDEE